MNYNTKQKREILALIKKLNTDFTAKDIFNYLNGEIGLTTVYRFVESLEEDGVIFRISSNDNTARYQYTKPCKRTDHIYLKCEQCGNLEHIDCEKIQGLTAHIAKEHHFTPGANTKLIINGFCANCRGEKHAENC